CCQPLGSWFTGVLSKFSETDDEPPPAPPLPPDPRAAMVVRILGPPCRQRAGGHPLELVGGHGSQGGGDRGEQVTRLQFFHAQDRPSPPLAAILHDRSSMKTTQEHVTISPGRSVWCILL